MTDTPIRLTPAEQAELDVLLQRSVELTPVIDRYTSDFNCWLDELAARIGLTTVELLTGFQISDGALVPANPFEVSEALTHHALEAMASVMLKIFPEPSSAGEETKPADPLEVLDQFSLLTYGGGLPKGLDFDLKND